MTTLACFVCDKVLTSALPGTPTENQPSRATCFRASGHYGSGAFDPMDGSMLEINVCDSCLLARASKTLLYPPPSRPSRDEARIWSDSAEPGWVHMSDGF